MAVSLLHSSAAPSFSTKPKSCPTRHSSSDCPLRKYGRLVLDEKMNILDINQMAEAILGRSREECILRNATEFISITKSCIYGSYTLLEIKSGSSQTIRIGSCVHILQNQLPSQSEPCARSFWYLCPASSLGIFPKTDGFYQLESVDESKCSALTISSYGIILKGRFSKNLMLSSDLNFSPLGLPIFHFIHLDDTLPFCRSIRWVREKRSKKFRIRWTSQPLTNSQAFTWVEFSCSSSNSCDEFTFIVRPVPPPPSKEECDHQGGFTSLLTVHKNQSLQSLIFETLGRIVPGITEVQDTTQLMQLLRQTASDGLTNLWALRFTVNVFLKLKSKFADLVPLYTKLMGELNFHPSSHSVEPSSLAAQFFMPMLKFLMFILMKLFHLVPFPFLKRLLSTSLHATPST